MEQITMLQLNQTYRQHVPIQQICKTNSKANKQTYKHTLSTMNRAHTTQQTPTPNTKSQLTDMSQMQPTNRNGTTLHPTLPSARKCKTQHDFSSRQRRERYSKTANQTSIVPTPIQVHREERKVENSIWSNTKHGINSGDMNKTQNKNTKTKITKHH